MATTAFERRVRDRNRSPVVSYRDETHKKVTPLPVGADTTLVEVVRLEVQVKIGETREYVGPWSAPCYDTTLESICWRYKRELRGYPPEPREDGIPLELTGTNVLCGFDSECPNHYVWVPFKDTWEEMKELGFRFAVYSVPNNKLMRGKSQVCWWAEHGTYQRDLDWEQLLQFLE